MKKITVMAYVYRSFGSLFCFALHPYMRKELDVDSKVPLQVNLDFDSDRGVKLKDIGKMRLKIAAQMLTGKLRVNPIFKVVER